MSQEELAGIINRSKSTLSKYESGKISIDINTLYEIAKALDIDIFQFIDEGKQDELVPAHSTPLFDGKDALYIYYYDGRSRTVVNTLLKIHYSRSEDNRIPCDCYMDFSDRKHYEECKYFYTGVVTSYELITYVMLDNLNYPMEHLMLSILNPFHRGMETWGLMLALSFKPITPLSLKFLIGPEPLERDLLNEEHLALSKSDLKTIKDLNMMLLNPSWP